MSYFSLSCLLLLFAPGSCSTRKEVPVHQQGRFRSRVYDDSGDPIIVFGNINDGGKLYCLELDGLFEAITYDTKTKKNPSFMADNFLDLEDDNVKWEYLHNSDGTQFSIFSTNLQGRANRIELSFNYRKVSGNDGIKFTVRIDGYRWKNPGASLVLFGDLERCDASNKFSIDDSGATTRRRRRRRRRRRLPSASTDNDRSDSVNPNDNGISSDDEDEYDLGSAVFQNTPTFTCGGRTYNTSLHYVDDGNGAEDKYEGLHIVYPYFGSCNVVQDPAVYVDEKKVSGNVKIGIASVFIALIIALISQ